MADLRATVRQGWESVAPRSCTSDAAAERPASENQAPGSLWTEEGAARMRGGAQSGQRASGSAEDKAAGIPVVSTRADRCRR